jgi:hypothetical protein
MQCMVSNVAVVNNLKCAVMNISFTTSESACDGFGCRLQSLILSNKQVGRHDGQ